MNATDLNIVRQHAQTSRLLGVDFVPVYRVRSAERDPTVEGPPLDTPVVGVTPAALPPAAPPDPRSRVQDPERKDAGESQRLLDALRERYEREAPHKQFVTGHTRIVFGEGDPCARLMFIGEAPGAEEDRTGRPFVGRAGQLLNQMIRAMGLARERVYIANVLKTRPPDNATPTSDEIRICAPYLFEQIAIVRPEAIVCLGLPASRALLDTTDSMSRLRGRWAAFRLPLPHEGEFPVMPTYHPAFLLRSYTADNRAKVWSDLKMVMTRLGLSSPMKAGANSGSLV